MRRGGGGGREEEEEEDEEEEEKQEEKEESNRPLAKISESIDSGNEIHARAISQFNFCSCLRSPCACKCTSNINGDAASTPTPIAWQDISVFQNHERGGGGVVRWRGGERIQHHRSGLLWTIRMAVPSRISGGCRREEEAEVLAPL